MPKSLMTMRGALRSAVLTAHLGALSLASLTACESAETPATEVVVTVTSHAELAPLLRRIRASVYDSDARDGGLPSQTQDFVLSADVDAGAQAKLPFSFGITPARAKRFLLVIEGFGSLDPAESPLIEQKQIGAFTADRTMTMSVLLSASCFQLYHPCEGLEQTCWPEARACGPLREATLTPPGSDPRVMDAGTLPSRNPPGCPPDACDANYPCTPTPPEGYVCLGARADFTMPYFGSKTPPSYDLGEPGIAVDRVTGLAWQRERPERYEGCTGIENRRGDLCTADEAKRYCKSLQLGGRAWRLPSRPELDSLLDLHVAKGALIDTTVFVNASQSYWTSSTVPIPAKQSGYLTSTWSFALGSTAVSLPHVHHAVRCVSGVPAGRGTPEQRFVVDEHAATVMDRTTALTWQRTPTVVATSLDEARASCAMLGDGWRLPDTKEMLGILDASRADPALPAAFPKPASNSLVWTEAVRHDGTRAYVLVEQLLGSPIIGEFAEVSALVRCVR